LPGALIAEATKVEFSSVEGAKAVFEAPTGNSEDGWTVGAPAPPHLPDYSRLTQTPF